MNEHPILFNGAMVRAILANRKTQTRRVVVPQPAGRWSFENPPVLGEILPPHPKANRFGVFALAGAGSDFQEVDLYPCPYGRPGDHLWVRETWAIEGQYRDGPGHCYRADGDKAGVHWKPSIYMPRAASRITLEITCVRVERVHGITTQDAINEGIASDGDAWTPIQKFVELWDSINAKRGYAWDTNPWVWVVEFAKLA